MRYHDVPPQLGNHLEMSRIKVETVSTPFSSGQWLVHFRKAWLKINDVAGTISYSPLTEGFVTSCWPHDEHRLVSAIPVQAGWSSVIRYTHNGIHLKLGCIGNNMLRESTRKLSGKSGS